MQTCLPKLLCLPNRIVAYKACNVERQRWVAEYALSVALFCIVSASPAFENLNDTDLQDGLQISRAQSH